MTLNQFLTEQRDKLNKFEAYWKIANQKDPNNYPYELDPGEWDNQLDVFDPEPEASNKSICAVISAIEVVTGIVYNHPVDVNSWVDCDLGCDQLNLNEAISLLEKWCSITISEDDIEARMDTQDGIADITVLELANIIDQKVKERDS